MNDYIKIVRKMQKNSENFVLATILEKNRISSKK